MARETSQQAARVSSADRVVHYIGDGIRAGRFVPGQRLVEADLSNSTGLSRGPIREALKRLSGEGVVTITLHRGAYIRFLQRSEAEKLVDVLEVLLGLAARLAARRIRLNENKRHLRDAYEHLNASRLDNDAMSYESERRHFYDTVIEIGGNEQIARVLPGTQRHLLRMQLRTFWSAKENETHNNDFLNVMSSISTGIPAKAERAMKAHIRRYRIGISKLPAAAFPVPP